MSLTEKDAEIIWLNMKLGDEKQLASRATLHRDVSRGTLNRDTSRTSFFGHDKTQQDGQIDTLTKEKEKLEKKVKELELSKIKVNDNINC